jgi:tetratricopeptide (TPR) repeat protein
MIEELGGNDELRAHALNNIATARISSGDIGGLDDLEESIEIAVAINSSEVVRAYGNQASILGDLGRLERHSEMLAKGIAAAERFGLRDYLHWLSAEALWPLYWDGRWSEAVPRLDELIDFFSESGFWMETPCRWLRGRIRLARGDTDGAQLDVDRAIERARLAKDPQVLWPGLALAARVYVTSDPSRAGAYVSEFLSDWLLRLSSSGANEWLADLAVTLSALGREHEFLEAVPHAKLPPNPWFEAAAAYLSGDFARAADVYAGIGSLPDEAYARLRAAEALVREGRRAEADAQLERSLAFWRTAGATGYVREGEALLAESA